MDFSSRIERLARSLGDIDVHTEPHYRIAYGYDATAVSGQCGGVAFPTCLDDLRRILDSSSKLGIPVFARGAGSGFSGGAVPLGGGLAVSTEKLARVLRLDEEAYEVEVECGLVNKDLQDLLEKSSLFYPPDPASFRFSTIGGNIAENAGGPRAFKYGVTRRYVRSLTWLTCSGDVVTGIHGGPGSLLTGSEGTLGVIYSARLSLLPKPEAFRTLLLEAGGGGDAMGVAAELISVGFCPSVLEYIDAKTIACVNEFKVLRGLNKDVSCLFIEIDGTLSEVRAQYSLLDDFCRKRGLDRIVAWNDAEREAIWELRRSISPSLARKGITKVNEDISLPLGRLAEAVPFIHDLAKGLYLDCYVFGHCGDGNLHVNIMTDRRKKEEMKRAERFVERLFARVVEMGGTLSGEHGIGTTKAPYLSMLFSPEELALQRRIKEAMDPLGLLNPGKYMTWNRDSGH